MKNKLLYTSYFFLAVGSLFLILENIFYQYVDKDGFLHESMFLPLGTFFVIVGLFLMLLKLVRKLF